MARSHPDRTRDTMDELIIQFERQRYQHIVSSILAIICRLFTLQNQSSISVCS